MLDDLGDSSLKLKKMQKDIERLQNVAGRGGDSQHPGASPGSIQLGDSANAAGTYSIAYGQSAWAEATYSVALGYNTYVDSAHSGSSAIGANATTTRPDQVSLGAPYGEVYVSGRLVLEPWDELGPQPYGPGDASAPVGAFAVDGDYIYVMTTAGWKRAPLSGF